MPMKQKTCQHNKAKLIKNQSYFKVVCACALLSLRIMPHIKIGLVRSESIISYKQNVLQKL